MTDKKRAKKLKRTKKFKKMFNIIRNSTITNAKKLKALKDLNKSIRTQINNIVFGEPKPEVPLELFEKGDSFELDREAAANFIKSDQSSGASNASISEQSSNDISQGNSESPRSD